MMAVAVLKTFFFVCLTLPFLWVPTASAESADLTCAILNPDIATPQTVQNAFQPLFDRLTQKVKKKINVIVYDSLEKTVADLNARKIDFGYAGIIDYFRLEAKAPIKPSLTLMKNGKTNYAACIAIRKSDEKATLADLKGKRLGYISFHKFYGGLFPQILLRDQKLEHRLERYFSSTTGYYSEISAVQDLVVGKIDACIVSRDALDIFEATTPWIIQKIKVLDCLEGLMFAPIFQRKDLDEDMNKSLQEETILFFDTPQGKQFMMMFKVDGVKRVTGSDYDADRKRAIALGYLNP
jgi:ABC-type phosphate/phosphonate transport system substrate-binding protein